MRTSHRRAALALLISLICALSFAAVATAASPEAIRACVEKNLIRYANPPPAVSVQYSDFQATCAAALDGSGASVQFTPAPAQTPSAGGGGAGRHGTGATGDTPANPAPGAPADPAPAAGPERPAEATPSPGDQSAQDVPEAVRRAVDAKGASVASPLPGLGALGDLPPWLLAALAAMAALTAGRVIAGHRKRS